MVRSNKKDAKSTNLARSSALRICILSIPQSSQFLADTYLNKISSATVGKGTHIKSTKASINSE